MTDDLQMRSALDIANEVRTAGYVFRRELRLMSRAEAARIAARVIAQGANGGLSAQYVDQVLRAIPGFGPKRVQELLKDTDVHRRSRIRDLPKDKREALAVAMQATVPQQRPPRPRPPEAPRRLPTAPLVGWINRRYGSLEVAAKALQTPGLASANIERTLRRLRSNDMVNTSTVEDLLTHAPISMHDLYPPEKYPGLYD
jgi:ribosomal protein S13